MVYEGPGLAARLARSLGERLARENTTLELLCGRDAALWLQPTDH